VVTLQRLSTKMPCLPQVTQSHYPNNFISTSEAISMAGTMIYFVNSLSVVQENKEYEQMLE
jgi:hypothetical protein